MPAGRKPKPPGQTVHRNPVTHPWQHTDRPGWQHGDPADRRRKYPAAPEGLMPDAVAAWDAWFRSWWAGNWHAEDLPQLVLVIRTFDEVLRGHLDVGKLTPLLDRYGVTPKGRQDLRWAPPKNDAPTSTGRSSSTSGGDRRLKVVDAG